MATVVGLFGFGGRWLWLKWYEIQNNVKNILIAMHAWKQLSTHVEQLYFSLKRFSTISETNRIS